MVCGSDCPAATAAANHSVKSSSGVAGAASGSKGGSSVTSGSQTRSDLSSS